jgi:hypothetical protein
MATTVTFQDMLNEYAPNAIFNEELVKQDYFLKTIEKDENWLGGDLIIPSKRNKGNSVSFGSLTAAASITKANYQRGKIEDYVEVWGSMIFDHADLMMHGKLSEQNLLKILPDEIEDSVQGIKEKVSIQISSGPHFAKVLDATNASSGILVVDHIDRFEMDELVTLDDGDSNQADYYVIGKDVNAGRTAGYPSSGTVTLSATSGGSAANVSAYSVAQSAKFYRSGVLVGGTVTNTFVSLRRALLSNANGGDANLHGKSKVLNPQLQAVNVDGSGVTATNILDKIFDAYTIVRSVAKGNASTVIMSYKHLGSCMKLIETSKGAYKQVGDTKASLYGWTEIDIVTVKGKLTLVGVQEMDDDIIAFMDWKACKFYSNGGFKKRMSPDGKEFFEIRNTSGYQYVVDVCFFGEVGWLKPGHCGIMHSIPAYT